MREKLNNNPLAQVAIVGGPAARYRIFVMSSMGGGARKKPRPNRVNRRLPQSPPTTAEASTLAVTGVAEGGGNRPRTGCPRRRRRAAPRPVTAAFESGDIVVLLFVKDGGIDDRLVTRTVDRLKGLSQVSTFVVPAHEIARYTTITQGVEVNRTPALVVVRPKHLTGGVPSASVQYGFQSPASVEQAVIDAGYKGPTVDYHP